MRAKKIQLSLLLSALSSKLSARRGIASLPLILLLGAIIVEVSVASVFFLSYLNTSVYGTRMANYALIAAQSGVNDAILRVVANVDSGGDPLPYEITGDDTITNVTICTGNNTPNPNCSSIGLGKRQIDSIGKALTRQHHLRAILSVHSVTGLVTIDSIKDIVN